MKVFISILLLSGLSVANATSNDLFQGAAEALDQLLVNGTYLGGGPGTTCRLTHLSTRDAGTGEILSSRTLLSENNIETGVFAREMPVEFFYDGRQPLEVATPTNYLLIKDPATRTELFILKFAKEQSIEVVLKQGGRESHCFFKVPVSSHSL